MKEILAKLTKGYDLTEVETKHAFGQLMSGKLSEAQIAAVLVGLACKGVSSGELAAAGAVMRSAVTPVPISVEAIDTCSTGGDGISTFNISTCAAIIAAGAGAYVAKHGNRSITRKSGSAEVLAQLGVNIEADVSTIAKCIEQAHIGFLFAIKLHPAMKYAGPVRQQLGIPTIFNLLGPMTNPAGVKRQVLGVSKEDQTEKIAWALKLLGAKRAMVVHGLDEGLCDLSICGPSKISELNDGKIKTYTIEPQQLGLTVGKLDQLLISSPAESASIIKSILGSKHGPQRDAAVLNAAAALVVAGLARDLAHGIQQAGKSIDSGQAQKCLQELVKISNG